MKNSRTLVCEKLVCLTNRVSGARVGVICKKALAVMLLTVSLATIAGCSGDDAGDDSGKGQEDAAREMEDAKTLVKQMRELTK